MSSSPASNAEQFAAILLVAGATGLLALFARRITAWTRIPAPLLLLVAAAIASNVWPVLHDIRHSAVENIVTLALIYILFEGGLSMGWREFRGAAVPIGVLGVLGTFLTVAGTAVFVHFSFDFGWFASLLLATAVSPTDPAVVFSVLSGLRGKAMTVLGGESGANDPVGIALMTGLISAAAVGWGPLGTIAWQFALQLVVGLIVGVLGGRAMVWIAYRLPMSSPSIDALRTGLCLLPIFGLAVLAHGSGFLAVFVAGILFGDERPPAQREIKGFHEALATLGEIVAFVVLGLTVDLGELSHPNVWVPGVLIGVLVAFIVRPIVVWGCLARSSLSANERIFVIFGGLKGAVPILLGTEILSAPHGVDDVKNRLYGIIVVVVIFSVLVQGHAHSDRGPAAWPDLGEERSGSAVLTA